MKKILTRIGAALLALMTVLSLTAPALALTAAPPTTKKVTILFTHDLHSHLLPSLNDDGSEYGGYARLMTAINEQREKYPDSILVDGGDFSMGSLFQTAYATAAIELRMMGTMGYDATTFGNHEFDYGADGFVSMLNTAVEATDAAKEIFAKLASSIATIVTEPSEGLDLQEFADMYGPMTIALPEIVNGNYYPPREGEQGYTETSQRVWDALENYGVKEYVLLERGGVHYAIFGINGEESHSYAPTSPMVLGDPAENAQRIVDAATAECVATHGVEPVVVCLSHSGTTDGEGEDVELAKAVDGIDLIVSGHSHTLLREPIRVNDTWIVSASEYGRNLGVVNMELQDGGYASLTGYELIPIDSTIADDEYIASLVEQFKHTVETNYLSAYGVTFDEVLVNNPYRFETVKEVYATQHESTLGNVFSDAYKWAAEQTLGETVDVAITAAGVIRESIPMGDVTVSDIFNAASIGVGTEGELVSAYLTGADLKNVLEVDASVQPLMEPAQLFSSGVEYSFNTSRMIFNKVDYAMLRRADGTLEEIEDDKLYHIVTGMYCGEMLGTVEGKSFGLLSATVRDENGDPIDMTRLADHVIRDADGNPLKEWYAISSYLAEMGGEMDEDYASPDGRKVVYASLAPADMLRNANLYTYIAGGAILLVVAVIALVVTRIVRKHRRKKRA